MSYSDSYLAQVNSTLHDIRAALPRATAPVERQRICANAMNYFISVYEELEDKPVNFEKSTLTDVSRAIVAYNQVQNAISTLAVDASSRLCQAPNKSMQVIIGLTTIQNDIASHMNNLIDRLAILTLRD